METEHTIEQRLQSEIDQLRNRFPETQDLYREACVLLFFRFGITPTANKLYQLVRKGSMSAPAEALNRFWEDLREKSRVRIEHPDLPDDLKTAAGDLTATLWNAAQRAAQDGLAALRSEAQSAVAEARAVAEAALVQSDAQRANADAAEQALETSKAQIRDLEQLLAAERARRDQLAEQLEQTKEQLSSMEVALGDARRDFTAELEKLAKAQSISEERFRAAEERALREIDRERTSAAKLAKDLDQFRAERARESSSLRDEISGLKAELASARQLATQVQHTLDAELTRRKNLEGDLAGCRSELGEAIGKSASARGELAATTDRLEDTRNELRAAQNCVQELRSTVTSLELKLEQEKAERNRRVRGKKSDGTA